MPQVAQLIGGAGTGKTSRLLQIMEQIVDRLGDPFQIGFVSFTRAARAEAAARAGDRFAVKQNELERSGWFRTIHSICYRQLGVGRALLTDNAESRAWLQDALQEDVGGAGGGEYDEMDAGGGDVNNEAQKAMNLWHAARNRLEPFRLTWDAANVRIPGQRPLVPPYARCVALIERYEEAKRLDHRCDFTDLLGRFAGWWFGVEGHSRRVPDGTVPALPAWFFDEWQDASALLDSVAQRLIDAPACKWVYAVGDQFQAIYSWAGADPKYFVDLPASKRDVMPKSYRCPQEVMQVGENVLRGCSDYWDRKIAPADHRGEARKVERFSPESLGQLVDPRENWLILTRTHALAKKWGKALDGLSIPWRSTHGRGGWDAPVRNAAIQALLSLEEGAPISGSQWQAALKYIPIKRDDGQALLSRGTKTRFDEMTREAAEDQYSWVMADELEQLGATPALGEVVRSQAWREWIPEAATYAKALEKWGREAVNEPAIRLGTIHSTKGQESDNVLLFSTITAPCFVGTKTPRGRDEENRVFYVGVTRARRRLIVANEDGVPFRKAIAM